MNDESYRGKRTSQFSRWLKTAQWRRVIGHLQVIAKMTASSCQADLGWDCSNCYRFTSFSWFIPPIPKYVNSTLIYLERSLHSQSIIIGHFSCRWKILWLIRFSASKGILKRGESNLLKGADSPLPRINLPCSWRSNNKRILWMIRNKWNFSLF